MKKKSLLLLMTALLCFQLTACGDEGETEEKESKVKTEESKEVTESKDSESENEETKDAQEIDSAEETVEEVVEEAEEELDPMLVHYEPMQEILDADFTDFKFQVDDTVYTLAYGMTFEELLQQVPDRYQIYDANKSYQIDENRLLEPSKGFSVSFLNSEKEDDLAFWVEVVNETEETIAIKDCVVMGMDFPGYYEGDCYAAKGILLNKSRKSQNPVRMEQDESFNFSTMKDILASWGIPEVENFAAMKEFLGQKYVAYVNTNGITYEIFALDDHPTVITVQGNKAMLKYTEYEIKFTISKETNNLSNVQFKRGTLATSWVNPEDYGLSIQ